MLQYTYLSTYSNPYVPWDTNYLYDSINLFRSNIGSAFGIGITIFILISGIYLAISIVKGLMH